MKDEKIKSEFKVRFYYHINQYYLPRYYLFRESN